MRSVYKLHSQLKLNISIPDIKLTKKVVLNYEADPLSFLREKKVGGFK